MNNISDKCVVTIVGNIIHFIFDSQYLLCSAFMRIQEFYESPYNEIKGKFFTAEKYMDLYAEIHNNEFTYFTDWIGFNIPGHVITNFKNLFSENSLSDKEIFILNELQQFIDKNEKFYVIGTFQSGVTKTIDHEFAHAFYYLDDEYKIACAKIYEQISNKTKAKINNKFKNYGYTEEVFEDETQAYLCTNDIERFILHSKEIKHISKQYIELFNKTYKDFYDKMVSAK